MMRRKAIKAIGIACLVLMGSCDDPIARKRVGATEFCVPRDNHVTTSYWWIPDSLPEGDGFRFAIPDFFGRNPELVPEHDRTGRTIVLGGRVTAEEPYLNWSKPRPGSYPFKEAQKPINTVERTQSPYVVIYSSPQNDAWSVWELPEGAQGSETVAELGRRVAHCRTYGHPLPLPGVSASCSRVVVTADKIAIAYSFSHDNLYQLTIFDNAIAKSVLSWKCRPV